MTSRDAAIEAAARALWATGGTDWYEANADERHYHRDCAETALDAALAVLQPTIDNTVEALDKLPVGTVLRGDDGSVRTRAPGGGWVKGAPLTGVRTVDLVNIGTYKRVTEWLVIYQPEGER